MEQVLQGTPYENQEFEFIGADALASGSITDLLGLNFTMHEITDNLDLQQAIDDGGIRITYVKDAGGANEESTVISSLTIGRISSELGSGDSLASTDDLQEGSVNQYFTDLRARVAAVLNSTVGNETDQAASVSALKQYVTDQQALLKDDILGGVDAQYDTLIELRDAIIANDGDISTLITSLATKLDASAVSAFGLTLIDDTDAATARATLELGSAAIADTTDFATASQGVLADSALQNGDNISELTNDAGYVDAAGAAAVAPVQSVNGLTGDGIV